MKAMGNIDWEGIAIGIIGFLGTFMFISQNTTKKDVAKNNTKINVMSANIKAESKAREDAIIGLEKSTNIQFDSIQKSLDRIEANTKKD